MNESPSLRTIDDIRQERGEYFPQKHRDIVTSRQIRTDFLIAAHDMIIAPPRNKSTLERLIFAGGFSARNTMIGLIKGKGKQLGLMGIFKKIVSFDQGILEPFALNDADFMGLLGEIQQLCAPETIRKTPERVTLTTVVAEKVETIVTGPHIMRRKITSPVILAILDAIPELPPEENKQEARVQKPTESTVPPVRSQGSFVQEKLPVYPPRRILPPAPRRGEKPQHPGKRQWVVPYYLKQQTSQQSLPETHIDPPVKIAPVPEFDTKALFLGHVRGNQKWHTGLSHLKTLKDDLACMAYMGQNGYQELSRMLSANKVKWGYPNFHAIIRDLDSPPAVIEEAIEKVVSEEVVSPQSKTVEPEFQLSAEHEKQFRDLFALHTSGKYQEFLTAFQKLQEDEEAVKELLGVQKTFGYKDALHTLAYISNSALLPRDIDAYRTHVWYERIYQLAGVRVQIERLLTHEKRDSMQTIKKILEDISIRVPDEIRTPWKGFEEHRIQKQRTLFDVVMQLVKTRKAYQKKDEDRTKRLILVVRQIAGQAEVTQDDEDISEE